jgi:hypothetical protein
MALQFHHTLERLEIWSAAADGFSFVISYETRSGTGFHGRPGFMATWRPLYKNNFAIRIAGTPFETFADAEEALQRHAKTSNGTRGRAAVGTFRAQACFPPGVTQKCSRLDGSICWHCVRPRKAEQRLRIKVRVPLIHINQSLGSAPCAASRSKVPKPLCLVDHPTLRL